MKMRTVEKELIDQEYTRPEKFNDEIESAINELREKISAIAKSHSEIWRANSQTTHEYKLIRKAARQDIITEIDLLLSNFQ